MSPRFFDYNKTLIVRARANRKDIIPNLPVKVMRQRVIGNYIADFYCASKKLVIEVDGDTHYTNEAREYDRERTAFFESLGIRVMRYPNNEVIENPDEVLEDLKRILAG